MLNVHSIVVIDDDYTVRTGLARNIPWEANGFVFLGTASDGEEGLKLIESTRPDIVISDIRIPFFNGLEITQIIKEKYPEMKVILLTGYDDFKYAQEALRLRAYDYIIKPVDNGVLLETAKSAAEELENEKKLQHQIMESMPLLRQRFLTDLVDGKYKDDAEIQSGISLTEIPLRQGSFIVFSVKLDDFFNTPYKANALEQEKLKIKVLNSCNAALNAPEKGIAFDSGLDELVVIIHGFSGGKDELYRNSSEVAEKIRKNVCSELKTTVTIGMGGVHGGYEGIPISCYEARSAMEYRHIYGKGQVLFIKDTGFPRDDEYIDIKASNRDILMKVRLGLADDALEIIGRIENEFLKTGFVTLNYARLAAIEIIIMVLKANEIRLQELGLADGLQNFYAICNEIYYLQTIHEIFGRVKKFISSISTAIAEDRESQQKKLVRKAAEYIEGHYAKEGLSLNDVAGTVHVNPTYLSIIFKKEMGKNFCDFVLDTRMNKAKELLRDSGMKTYEVAEKVGYSNPQYFSVCFKKHTGLAPQEFKSFNPDRAKIK